MQILRDLQSRYGAVPWRFDVASLRTVLHRTDRRVPKPPTATLEKAVSELDDGVAEELVIDELLVDLRAASQCLAADSTL